MDDPRPPQTPRAKFDTLLADQRHFRGDLKLMRRAIRAGWLIDKADRDALVDRFEQAATPELKDPTTTKNPLNFRRTFGIANVMIEMTRQNQRGLDYLQWWGYSDQATGRPRLGRRASDLGRPLDTAMVRRHLASQGITDLSVMHWVNVCAGPTEADTVPVRTRGRRLPRGGWALWLLCPRCGHQRLRLYVDGHRIACRGCLGLGYARASCA